MARATVSESRASDSRSIITLQGRFDLRKAREKFEDHIVRVIEIVSEDEYSYPRVPTLVSRSPYTPCPLPPPPPYPYTPQPYPYRPIPYSGTYPPLNYPARYAPVPYPFRPPPYYARYPPPSSEYTPVSQYPPPRGMHPPHPPY